MIVAAALAGAGGSGLSLVLVSATTDPSSSLLNYGVAGIVGALAIGLVYRVLTRLEKQNDALQAKVDRLNELIPQVMQEKVLPTLTSASSALEKVVDLVSDVRATEALLRQQAAAPPTRARGGR